MNNIWFTADTHFLHENIVKHSKRPFSGEEDMQQQLIARWNATVAPGDTVYHLGDFALSYGRETAQEIDDILAQLNGQKILIVGNHDRKEVIKNPRWAVVHRMHEIKLDLGGVHKQRIVMCHYPIVSWNQMHRGAWMLHGHCHGNLAPQEGRIIDVGVDCFDFTPVGIDQLRSILEPRPIYGVDHHRP
jgi:calcineurin-like phosphoesterase family protein